MAALICSYCGRDTMTIETHEMQLSEPYGGTSTVTIREKVCGHCGFVEDDEANDLAIQKELTALKRRSMMTRLDALNGMGHTNAAMERALGLPARTLARWKNEQTTSPSAAGVALMRIIRTFPWILEVADVQFDKTKARKVLLQAAMDEIVKIGDEHPEVLP